MFCSYKFTLSNSVIVLFVVVIVSVEINRSITFRTTYIDIYPLTRTTHALKARYKVQNLVLIDTVAQLKF